MGKTKKNDNFLWNVLQQTPKNISPTKKAAEKAAL
jgi:hypothetical protein